MFLSKVGIKNYKIFEGNFEMEFDSGDLNILIGKNNCGKSSILEVINLYNFRGKLKAECLNRIAKERNDGEVVFVFTFTDSNFTNHIELKYIHTYEFQKNDFKIPTIYIDDELVNKQYYNSKLLESNDLEGLLDVLHIPKIYYINPDTSTDKFEMMANEIIQSKFLEVERNIDDIDEGVTSILSDFTTTIQQNLTNMQSGVSDTMTRTFGTASNIEFSTEISPLTIKELAKKFKLNINWDNLDLNAQGTGFQRVLIISLIKSAMEANFISNKILLIDEPEAYLHPQAIEYLSKELYRLEEIQCIISTHSPIMIDISSTTRDLKILKIIEDKTTPQLLLEVNDTFRQEPEVEQLKLHNIINPYLNEYFFADKVILVEGDVEEMLFKKLIEELDVSINMKVINAHGKGTMKNYLKILNNFDIEISVLYDADNFRENFDGSTREPRSLRASETSSLNIFDSALNNEKAKVYISNGTIEYALNGKRTSSNQKVSTALGILDDTYKLEILNSVLRNMIFDETLVECEIKKINDLHEINEYYTAEKLIID